MKENNIRELNIIYNLLLENNYSRLTTTEKTIIAKLLLKELRQINCYDYQKTNCPFSSITFIDEGQTEVTCKNLDLAEYYYCSDPKEASRIKKCPFSKIENNIVNLINSLNGNEQKNQQDTDINKQTKVIFKSKTTNKIKVKTKIQKRK